MRLRVTVWPRFPGVREAPMMATCLGSNRGRKDSMRSGISVPSRPRHRLLRLYHASAYTSPFESPDTLDSTRGGWRAIEPYQPIAGPWPNSGYPAGPGLSSGSGQTHGGRAVG